MLTAFSVVLGTLVIQGLTLKPLLRALDLHDDDPVGREVCTARQRALAAGLECLALDESPSPTVSVANSGRVSAIIQRAPTESTREPYAARCTATPSSWRGARSWRCA